MYLIQILLPLYDNEQHPFARTAFDEVRRELTEQFGGVTAYSRSPARGVWKEEGGEVSSDEVVIYEVMADELERAWWQEYKQELARRFRQKEMLIRASRVDQL